MGSGWIWGIIGGGWKRRRRGRVGVARWDDY